jgi:L-fuconolactonase
VRIDSHHHFWRYKPAEYDWIGEDMGVLRRDFLPEHLAAEIRAVRIDGVVSVQARQTVAETAALLEFAAANDFIKGVVGWVPLISPTVDRDLAAFASAEKLRGVRHVLQGEPDDFYILRSDFNAGIRALRGTGLVYDILIFERHLPQTCTFVDRHPDQVFVLDHISKPRIKDGVFEPWNTEIRELAKRDHVFCKLSGMVTEASWSAWTPELLQPYVDTVLEAFGPARTMFGSDWPVCLVASGYTRWMETVERFTAALSEDEQARIFGGTATQVYRLA